MNSNPWDDEVPVVKPNVYELLARQKKVTALLLALDMEVGHQITESDICNLDFETLERAYLRAALKHKPSAKAIAQLVERIRDRDQSRIESRHGKDNDTW